MFQFISDYQKPPDKAFGRDIETGIRPHVSYLSGGNPLPSAVGNLLKQLKHQMTLLPTEISDQKVPDFFEKEKLKTMEGEKGFNLRKPIRAHLF